MAIMTTTASVITGAVAIMSTIKAEDKEIDTKSDDVNKSD